MFFLAYLAEICGYARKHRPGLCNNVQNNIELKLLIFARVYLRAIGEYCETIQAMF